VAARYKTLELAGFKVDSHTIISELGIKKNKDKDLRENEVSEALEKTLAILQKIRHILQE
jgi:uncharacterized metal-binding protein